MRCLALVGETNVELLPYYARLIAEDVRHRLGSEVKPNIFALALPQISFPLVEAIQTLRHLGAEASLVCSSALQPDNPDSFELPLISMHKPVATALQKSSLKRVGLIGTRGFVEEKRWQAELAKSGVSDCLLPVPSDRGHLVKLCDQELGRGVVTETARADVVRTVHSLKHAGARAVVVVAPELTELLQDAVPVLPVYDVAEYHALAAVDWMTAAIAPVVTAEGAREML